MKIKMFNFKMNLILMSTIGIIGPMAVTAMEIQVSGQGNAAVASLNNGIAELERRAKADDSLALELLKSMPKNNAKQKNDLINAYNQRFTVQKEQNKKAKKIAADAGIALPNVGKRQALTALGMAMEVQQISTVGYVPPPSSVAAIVIGGHGDVYIRAAHHELQTRVNAGDPLAKVVFDVYGTLMQRNFQFAQSAINEYNRSYLLLTAGGVIAPLLPGGGGVLHGRGGGAPPVVVAPPPGGGGGLANIERAAFLAQIAALQARIAALEAQLRAGGAGGGAAAAPTIQTIYDNFKRYLENNTHVPSYRGGMHNIKEFLDELLHEDSSDRAIDGFMDVIKNVILNTPGIVRQNAISNAFSDLNQDQALNGYNLNLIKRQVKSTEDSLIYPDGNLIISTLPSQPDDAYLKTHPLLMLQYTDRAKAATVWQNENMETYKNLAKSAPLNEVKGAYTVLTKDWKIRYNPEDRSGSKIQSFLQICYDRIVNNTPSIANAYTPAYIEQFITKRLQKDLKTDFFQLEKTNIGSFQEDYDRVRANIGMLQPLKPLLKAITYDLATWNQRGLSRSDYDNFIAFFEYLSTGELKAILYHLSNIHLATQSPSPENTYFYNALNEAVSSRPTGFIHTTMNAPAKIQMTRLINPPVVGGVAPRLAALGVPGGPPPPPPPPGALGAPPPPPPLAVGPPAGGGAGAPRVAVAFAAGSEAEAVENALIREGVDRGIANEAAHSIYNSADPKATKKRKVMGVLDRTGITNVGNVAQYRATLDRAIR